MVSFLHEMLLNLLYGGLWAGGFIAALLLMAWGFGLYRLLSLEENKALSMKMLGGHVCSFIQSSTLSFDNHGKIVIGSGPQTFGWSLFPFLFRVRGAVVYLWPLFWPNDYEKTNKKGDGFGAGNFVDLQDIPGEITTPMAETKDGVPISVTFETTRRVTDPRAFQYDSPEDVIHQADKRTEAEFARWIATVTDDQVQEFRGNGQALWQSLEAGGFNLFLVVMEEGSTGGTRPQRAWGLQTIPNSVIIRKIDYDPDYQRAKKARKEADLNADAEVVRLSVPDRMFRDWVEARVTGGTDAERDVSRKAILATAEAKEKEAYYQKVWQLVLGAEVRDNTYHIDGGDLSSAIALADAFGLGVVRGGKRQTSTSTSTKPTSHANKTQQEKANEWAKAHAGQRPGWYKGPRLSDETEASWKNAGSPT